MHLAIILYVFVVFVVSAPGQCASLSSFGFRFSPPFIYIFYIYFINCIKYEPGVSRRSEYSGGLYTYFRLLLLCSACFVFGQLKLFTFN